MTLQDWLERKEVVVAARDAKVEALPISYSQSQSMVALSVSGMDSGNGLVFQGWTPN